jgi:hypothetical protein
MGIAFAAGSKRGVSEPRSRRRPRAHRVVHAKGHASVAAEIELCTVAVQVLLAAVLGDALHPAVETIKTWFKGKAMGVGSRSSHERFARAYLTESVTVRPYGKQEEL